MSVNRIGMTMKTIQAPWVNFVTVTMIEHAGGHDGAEGVDRPGRAHDRRPGPVGAVAQHPEPVPHHAGLAERERDEHADDVELDEGGDVGLEHHQDDDGRDRRGR